MTFSRSLDGQVFDSYRVRFCGSMDLDEEQATRLGRGEEIALTVLGTVTDVNVKTIKGDAVRVAVLKVIDTNFDKLEAATAAIEIAQLFEVAKAPVAPDSPEEWRAWVRRDDEKTVTNVPGNEFPAAQNFPETDNDGYFTEVVGRIGNGLTRDRPMAASGPRVLPFTDETVREVDKLDAGQPLARVGSRDGALSRFIDEAVG